MNLFETITIQWWMGSHAHTHTHGKSLTNFVCIIRFIPNSITQHFANTLLLNSHSCPYLNEAKQRTERKKEGRKKTVLQILQC